MSVRALRLAAVVLVVSSFALPMFADSFVANGSGNWSSTATWMQNGLPATRYPGALVGTIDSVAVTASFYTVTVDVALAERVTMTTTCPSNTSTCVVDVASGGALLLTGASSIGTDARLKISGGTVDNGGILTLASASKLDWTSGTLGGSGSTTANAGSNVNASGPGNMILAGGQTLSLFGTVTYGGGQLYQNGGSDVIVKSGGVFDVQIINGIATDNASTASITVDSGGLFKKSGGAFGTNIDPTFFNNGAVQVSVGTLALYRGTYTGTFASTAAGATFTFGYPGTHTFSGTNVSISGTDEVFFGGAVVLAAGADVDVVNLQNDSFASFSGSGTLNVSGTWRWRASTISGITVNVLANATLNVTAEASTTLTTNAHINNQGTIDLNTGAGSLSINSGGHITNDGDFNLLGDVTIFSNALANARIDNLATRTIDKNSGVSMATINAVLNNSGSVSVTSGGLKLTRGGTHAGSWFAGTTASIELVANTNQFVGGSMGGTGTFGLSGGTMDVDTALALPASLTFKLTGGVLTGSGNVTINGPFLWTGGTMDTSSGSGQTIVTGSTSQIATTTAAATLSGRTLSHTGTLTYTATAPNFFTINNGGSFLNTGSFNFGGDFQINGNNVSTPRFINGTGGAINKSSGSGTAQFFVYFQSDSSINLGSGTITLSAGGQNVGVVNFGSASNKIIIDNSIFGISTTPGINGPGTITVSGTNARLALLAPMTVENFELLGGTVDSGDLTVGTMMKWTGGTLGPGGTTTLNTATLDHAPTATTTVDGQTLALNSSTFTYSAAGFGLTLTNNAAININGGSLFDSTDAGAIVNGAGSNAIQIASGGTLRKSGGTSGTRVDVPVQNGGTISSEVAGQSLILNGGGSMTAGQLSTSAGALLDFTGGTFSYSGGTITGSGAYRIVIAGTFAVNASLATATKWELQNGSTLDVAATKVFAPDVFTWRGGTVQGGGQTRAGSGSITNFGPSTLTGNHLFETLGAFSYDADAANYLTINGGSTFLVNAAGTLNLTTDAPIAGSGTLNNMGVTTKTAGTTSRIDAVVASSGTSIGASAGRLQLAGGGTISGGIDTGANAIVDFSGGTLTIGSGASILGSGDFVISGAIVNVNTPLTIPDFYLTAGTLGGASAVTLQGGIWSGGNMTGSGTTNVPGGKTFAVESNAAKHLARTFTNGGTLKFQNGPIALTLDDGASLTNSALVQISTDGTIDCACSTTPADIGNAGTWTRSGSAGTFAVAAPFRNLGIVDALSGRLAFDGTGTHDGTFNANATLALRGPSHTFNAASNVQGGGTVEFSAATSTVGGGYTLTGSGYTQLVGGQTNFNTSATTPRLRIAANAGGSGAIHTSNAEWKSGVVTIDSDVSTQLDVNGILGAMTLDNATLTIANAAVANYTSSNVLTLANGASIVNQGTFNDSTATAINASGASSIVNNGTFRRNAAGTQTIAPPFTNGGTTELQSGTTAFNGGFTSTGAVKLLGGQLSSTAVVDLQGGTLSGTGTITANVSNAATINPGTSPGTIAVNGNYTQTANGTLNIELAGTTPGTQFDQLNISGNASLGGTINVSFLGGYLPSGGETYDVVTFASKSGDFAVKNFPTFPMGGSIDGVYVPPVAPTAFQLQANTTQADLVVAQTTSGPAQQGDDVTFTVTITNNGPQTASGVTLNDTFTNATFVSATGPIATCSGTGPITCAIGSLAAGQSTTVTVTLDATNLGTISNSASVTTTTFDPITTNNGPDTATIPVGPTADLQITKSGPSTAQSGGTIVYTITVKNHGASSAADVVVTDTPSSRLVFVSNSGACTGPFPCSLGTMNAGDIKVITATYEVLRNSNGRTITNMAMVSSPTPDANSSNNQSSTTATIDCANLTPANLQPSGSGHAASGTLSWTGAGDQYIVYLGPAGSGCATYFATTFDNSIAYNLEAGKSYEWRVESIAGTCPVRSTTCVTFSTKADDTCTTPQQPAARVVGQTTSGKTYDVSWDAVAGATRYEIDEATNAAFTNATTLVVTTTAQSYKHDVNAGAAFFYRVRAFNACSATPSAYSTTVRTVVVPVPAKEQNDPSINVPAGTQELIVQQVFVPGEAGQSLFFNASTDRDWLTVRPASGILPPQGVTLEVVADPRTLPNGTFTASILVAINGSSASNVATHGGTTATIPFSVNLVTPVSPVQSKGATSEYAMVIPSVGHLDGINSHWQSDVRITNAGFRSTRYRLTYTPAGGTAQGVKQTTITVDAGATTALDDVIRNWYGIGSLGESGSGMLEILPLDDPATASLTTVASSRTYNVTENGTLGQFIPAIRYPNFVGRALQGALPQLLSIQQIAQNASYRTNVGVAEASGNPASVLLSIFGANGNKLSEVPIELGAGEQRQLNSLLAERGIELADGRVEVQVTGGSGKVTAYASVVDNATRDPLLVAGTPLAQSTASKWVLPGAANLDNAVAHWRTDMRVFNYGNAPQPATLTFFPNGGGEARSANVTLSAGTVMTLDNVVRTLFSADGLGGVVHLQTAAPSNLVVTGRTYNQTDNGTFGQFIPAVTTDMGVGANERSLHILQVEDSVRYRTNLGLAEITGRPVTVEVQVVLPDSKVTPTVTIPLAANEFRQFAVIRQLGLGNVYNARVRIRVISGDGRVTAYGSVIDETTQDPTYIPAQ